VSYIERFTYALQEETEGQCHPWSKTLSESGKKSQTINNWKCAFEKVWGASAKVKDLFCTGHACVLRSWGTWILCTLGTNNTACSTPSVQAHVTLWTFLSFCTRNPLSCSSYGTQQSKSCFVVPINNLNFLSTPFVHLQLRSCLANGFHDFSENSHILLNFCFFISKDVGLWQLITQSGMPGFLSVSLSG
jgi:hypothetical protein